MRPDVFAHGFGLPHALINFLGYIFVAVSGAIDEFNFQSLGNRIITRGRHITGNDRMELDDGVICHWLLPQNLPKPGPCSLWMRST